VSKLQHAIGVDVFLRHSVVVVNSEATMFAGRLCRVRVSRSVRLRDAVQDVRTRRTSLFSVVVQHIRLRCKFSRRPRPAVLIANAERKRKEEYLYGAIYKPIVLIFALTVSSELIGFCF